MKLLEVDSLSTHYVSAGGTRVTRAVDKVSFSLDAGGTLGVVGESGSGKTTLARCIAGLHAAYEGEISFRGRTLPPGARARDR